MATDSTQQHRNLANKLVDASTRFVDALYDLTQLCDQKAKLSEPFADGDFQYPGSDQAHLDAAMLNVLCDDVVPSLEANYHDDANGGRNEQILQQVRKG